MATLAVKKACSTCCKQKIVYPCQGCLRDFCMEDLTKHNQFIAEQFSILQNEYDQFRQELFERKDDSRKHPLIRYVNQWEEDSIKKIKATAKECRDILIKQINKYIAEIKTRLSVLVEQLRVIHRENECNEMDFNRLKKKLKELANELDQPTSITIREDPTPFISKISIVINLTKTGEDVNKPITKPYNNTFTVAADDVCARSKTDSYSVRPNNRWTQNGVTIAGGRGNGAAMNQLSGPLGFYIDENQTIFIADCGNDRIVQWKINATSGQAVAGGNGQGNRTDQLNKPTDVIVDKETNSLIICDSGNRRVMRWSRQNGIKNGEVILENIDCWGLTMDDQRFLYVSNPERHEVRRYRMGEKDGIIVAGGNGDGQHVNQLSNPTYLFISQDYSLYVSDCWNHRVMKWMKGAKEGIVVAGGHGEGTSLNQLTYPLGIFVDSLGAVYVAEESNHRVTCFRKKVTQGEVVVGGNGKGSEANQLYYPNGLWLDQHDYLYVVDRWNHRVQRFSVEGS